MGSGLSSGSTNISKTCEWWRETCIRASGGVLWSKRVLGAASGSSWRLGSGSSWRLGSGSSWRLGSGHLREDKRCSCIDTTNHINMWLRTQQLVYWRTSPLNASLKPVELIFSRELVELLIFLLHYILHNKGQCDYHVPAYTYFAEFTSVQWQQLDHNYNRVHNGVHTFTFSGGPVCFFLSNSLVWSGSSGMSSS